MKQDLRKRIYVAGHRGLVGSAIVRALNRHDCNNIVTRSHAELELTDQAQVRAFFASERIDEVYLWTLSRLPVDEERQACRKYLKDSPSPERGLQDVLWSLLNTREFLLNH